MYLKALLRRQTMRTIEIDDDLYIHIASQTIEIGESANSILRRILGLPHRGQDTSDTQPHELAQVLDHPGLRFKTTVDQFLFILGEAYKLKPNTFDQILTIQGRERIYFARSREEIERSGNSTQPKQIPGTDYWVMTNSPNRQKKSMLREALLAIGMSKQAAEAAARTLPL
jgi:negative modulator of initiation of replication